MSMNVSIILILFILKDWWADNNKYLYLEMSEHLLVFPFSVGLAVLAVRFSGILFGSTTNVGEIMIIKDN